MRRKPLFPPPHSATTGKRLANKGRQRRKVLTINGRIELARRWWFDPQEGSVAPVETIYNSAGDTITRGVRELACRLNQKGPSFQAVAENLARTAQLTMCGETLRQLIEAEGQRVLAAQQTAAIDTAWTAADCAVSPEKTRVYTGCDGVMVPLVTDAEKRLRRAKVKEKRRRSGRKCRPLPALKKGADQAWKEMKVVYYYSEDMRRQHVATTMQNHRAAGRLMRREADRLNFRAATERVGLIDGAPWIRLEMEEHLAELDGLGLDFYHLGENVHRARRAVFGEEAVEGQAWATELMHTFKHQGYAAAWQTLVAWRAPLRSKKRKAADRLLHYVAEREAMIRYPAFQEKGWQIGSGPTESQCKLSVDRLKGRGRRWERRHAAAVAALDGLARSGQWQSYWQTPAPIPT
jgi:hypothetical protein